MRVCKRSFILATLVGIGDLGIACNRSSYQDPTSCSGVYSIQGIAVIPPRLRLDGTGRVYLHPAGSGVQFEAKMNFQRPARSLRFSGFATASIWTDTYCEPLTYAQLGHSDSRRFRVAFIHPVPADQPKQQSFL
jgi:hypothetical protein